MSSTAIITGDLGPGYSVTSLTLANVTRFAIDTASQVLEVFFGDNRIQHFDISEAATITVDYDDGVYTLTIEET